MSVRSGKAEKNVADNSISKEKRNEKMVEEEEESLDHNRCQEKNLSLVAFRQKKSHVNVTKMRESNIEVNGEVSYERINQYREDIRRSSGKIR